MRADAKAVNFGVIYGMTDFGLTEDEQIAAYTARIITSSPIQISTNFELFNEFELSVYCNEEVIAINQDSAANAAKPYLIIEDGKNMIHVLKKKLADGDCAFAVFNLGECKSDVKIYLDDISYIRDVWVKTDLNSSSKISLSGMKPHTARLFRTKSCASMI